MHIFLNNWDELSLGIASRKCIRRDIETDKVIHYGYAIEIGLIFISIVIEL